jgi:predicted nicotinamide N-methyase
MFAQTRFMAVVLLLLGFFGGATLAFLVSSPAPNPQLDRRRAFPPHIITANTFLLDSSSSTLEREILRHLILVDEETGEILAKGQELQALAQERDQADQDELELMYPTQRQYFQFGDSSKYPVQIVRTTSFGCGKLGHQVWPSAMALSLALVHEYTSSEDASTRIPKSVLELGAGCGLPSVVCRDVLHVPVIATDFWYDEAADRDWDRLIPEVHHGINLVHNVARGDKARVQSLDWHNIESVRKLGPVDLVIGSDVIYYPMDIEPLWKTLETLLRDGGATKVILVSPLKPDIREAMPEFLELLESKSSKDHGDFDLEQQGLYLYKSRENLEAGEGGEHFLKLSLSLRT